MATPSTPLPTETEDPPNIAPPSSEQSKEPMYPDGIIDPDDPLLIAQTLTYVTDNGSVVLSFTSAPFSLAFKVRFVLSEILFISILLYKFPQVGTHNLILTIAISNLLLVAWFWYNSVRNVELTTDATLRFWIGNIEVDVPFDKIVELRKMSGGMAIFSPGLLPHRGYLSTPSDGVAIITSVPSTPFFMWPRSAGRPERRLGPFSCPRLKIIMSPAGGAANFINLCQEEMRSHIDGTGRREMGSGSIVSGLTQPPAFDRRNDGASDFYDV